MALSSQLIQLVRREFVLDWGGIHGAPHWARVRENGLRLSETTGANVKVVEAFAFLHDSQRRHDGDDRDHGRRAAELVRTLPNSLLDLVASDIALLAAACEGHSDGGVATDMTVSTCWDADRLDLGRVGIVPDPARLCTDAARDPALIRWAYRRSSRDVGNSRV
jgi:uncharacterized protein